MSAAVRARGWWRARAAAGAALAIAASGGACRHGPARPWRAHDLPGASTAGTGGVARPGAPAHVRPASRAEAEAALARAEAAATAAARMRDPGDAGGETADRALVIAAGDVVALGGTIDAARPAVWAAIDRLGVRDLDRVWPALDPRRAPAGAVAMRRALLAHHQGDDAAARRWLARARAAGDAALVAAAATRLGADLGGTVDPAVIAVLVPETGRFAALGAELEAAIRLAPPGGARLVFLDTAGDPARAAAAVDRADALGAVAVLGPVGEREAAAAARRAAERGLPIALLSPGDGADPAAGVFRLATSPADEARMAADLAADQRFPTAAVLAPRDEIGDEMAAAFAAEAKARGVDVTARGSYDPSASNLEPDVKAFLGLDPRTNPRLAAWLRTHGRRGWQTFVPDVPFSLLYVPDRYDRAALVASFLPYLGVALRTREIEDPDELRRKYGGRIPQVVQLVGSSGWDDPSLATRGGDAVEGALIVDVFAAGGDGGDGAPAAAAFAAAFTAATGRAPTAAAAQAHDAARLVLAARAAAAGATGAARPAFAAALARGRLDDGACGPATVGADGELARTPTVLEVDGGQLVPAPE